jgi:hypothetical protein
MSKDAPMPHNLDHLLDAAIEHHGALPEIGVVGFADAAGADAIMAAYGYSRHAAGSALEYRKTS